MNLSTDMTCMSSKITSKWEKKTLLVRMRTITFTFTVLKLMIFKNKFIWVGMVRK